jgi:hypothetical protein
MAAETLTSTRAAASFPVFKASGSGIVCAAHGTYAIAANVEDGDIFEMCKVPAGATLLGGYFYGADLDTGTETLDMDVGWAANGGSGTYDSADPDGLGNFGVLTGDAFAAGNVSNVTGLNYPLNGLFATGVLPTFTAETTIQVEANAAAATFAAGSISVVAFYVVD